MAKQEQVLIIEPQNELKFRGPFITPVTSFLKLTNPTTSYVCFKIKTTAPKRYCVRPNSGVLEPKGVISIAVSLQPFEFDPNEKNKHKFMVQTLIAPEGKVNLDMLWKEVDPESLMDSKLKCVFEMPVDDETPNPTAPSELTTASDETRRIGDSANVNHDGGELAKAAKEVKHLRAEESCLRQENLLLKEELLQLHHQIYTGSGGTAQISSTTPVPTPVAAVPSILYIGFALGMGLLGILLGKFLL
ncbi:VAMP-associated protein 33kDa [Lycorma delicatula]|uniref:VAMP-associated protein 33kDa n=1 Tax=Lycorma delicatula TaxID=130591 RepID=UPI003F515371